MKLGPKWTMEIVTDDDEEKLSFPEPNWVSPTYRIRISCYGKTIFEGILHDFDLYENNGETIIDFLRWLEQRPS